MDAATILANINTSTILANITSNPMYPASAAALIAGCGIDWWHGKDPFLGAIKGYLLVIVSSHLFVALILLGIIIAQPSV